MAKLTFLGTGLIGAAMAKAAAERGADVRAWNRTRSKAEALTAFGIEVFDTPAEAMAGADRVHLAFSDDAAVEAVLEACGDALEGAVLVDHTTAAPLKTELRAARLAEAGVTYIHAPVFMSPAAAYATTGMMLAAGPREAFANVSEGLEAMTGRVLYLGEDMRRAAAFKLFGNAMIISLVGGLSDVFAMADSLGISSEDAYTLFESFNPANTLTYRGKKMSEGNYETSFELTMARKDVRLMLEASQGAELAVLPGIAERMDALIAAGFGGRDVGVLAQGAVPETQD